jgi:hypothetical protein
MHKATVGALWVLWLSACSGGGGTGTGGGSGGGGATGTVARIELKPDFAFLAVGERLQLVPAALDANGNVLAGVAFSWTSSDPAVASVDQGLVTALVEGVAFVSVQADGVSGGPISIAVTQERPPSPPSDELIEQARAGGLIDDETALLYRVYAVFKDPRLPLQYVGNNVDVIDSSALDDVRERWASLSEATQRQLEPFFAPPAYLGSWASLDKKPRSLLGICKQPVLDPNWASVPATSGGRVKVWYDTRVPGAQAQAQKVSSEFETKIYDAVTSPSGLGLASPLSDAAEAGCNGGDGRLDVYLVDMGVMGETGTDYGETFAVAPSLKHAPVFLLLKRSLDEPKLLATAAHEFSHACQWAYPVSAFALASYTWLKESSAQEVIDYVYPLSNVEQNATFLRLYLDAPSQPIHEGDRNRAYGSYLFFQFLVRSQGPKTIGDIWNQTRTQSDQLAAVDLGIPGGLKQRWPEFATTLWNDDPVNMRPASFTQWDRMLETPLYVSGSGDLGGAPQGTQSFATSQPNVSVRFAQVTFSEVPTRSLMFHNTWFQPYRAMQPIHVTALWKTEDGVWSEEDWSDLEWIGFCRDQKDQRLEQLVLIVSSAKREGAELMATEAPTLERSNLPCWGIEGTATRVTREQSWTGTATATLTGRFQGTGPAQYFNPVEGKLRVEIGWTTFQSGQATLDENYSTGSCSYRANGTFPASAYTAGGDVSGIWIVNKFPASRPPDISTEMLAILGPAERAYSVAVVSNRQVMGTVSGPAPCPGTYTTTLGNILVTQSDNYETGGVPKVAGPNGEFTGTLVDYADTYTWSYTPLREP